MLPDIEEKFERGHKIIMKFKIPAKNALLILGAKDIYMNLIVQSAKRNYEYNISMFFP